MSELKKDVMMEGQERRSRVQSALMLEDGGRAYELRTKIGSFETGKEYIKAVYCHPAYLTYMQSTSCETVGWMEHKLETRLLGEISITSDPRDGGVWWAAIYRVTQSWT